MSVEIRAGTSGYSYPEWKGSFYPEKLAARDMLGFYARRFPTVEINNTFYRMPTDALLSGWAGQVPEDFAFAIKAPRRITHDRRLVDCGEPVTRLFRAAATLGARLGPLLFQLPPHFKKDAPRLADFLNAMPERRRIAFEFRHASWFDDEVFDTLRAHGAALCVADTGEEPAAPLVATTDWGYLRLRREHFTDEELRKWARRIVEQPWRDAYVYLKHEEEGEGPRLATRLMELGEEQGARVVRPAPAREAAAGAEARPPA